MQDQPFESLCSQLTAPLQLRLQMLPAAETLRLREIRIRRRAPLCLVFEDGVRFLGETGVARALPTGAFRIDDTMFDALFQKLCGYSLHSVSDALCAGFLTLAGGHRVGVGGTAVLHGGAVTAVREIGFLALRIARACLGCAEPLLNESAQGTRSLLLAGPPCSGKTTLLRELARLLSSEQCGCRKVVLCDERGELAAAHAGVPQLPVGINTDVLTGYPKPKAISIAARAFAPDYLILDEIASAEEAEAVARAVNCGIRFALSLHADSAAALRAKPQLQALLATGEFQQVLLLSAHPPGVIAQRIPAEALLA